MNVQNWYTLIYRIHINRHISETIILFEYTERKSPVSIRPTKASFTTHISRYVSLFVLRRHIRQKMVQRTSDIIHNTQIVLCTTDIIFLVILSLLLNLQNLCAPQIHTKMMRMFYKPLQFITSSGFCAFLAATLRILVRGGTLIFCRIQLFFQFIFGCP